MRRYGLLAQSSGAGRAGLAGLHGDAVRRRLGAAPAMRHGSGEETSAAQGVTWRVLDAFTFSSSAAGSSVRQPVSSSSRRRSGQRLRHQQSRTGCEATHLCA